MRTLGNILWHFPCFGFISAGGTFLLGLLLTGTVVAAPIGLGLIQFSKFLLAPFGQTMVRKSTLGVEQNRTWLAYSWLVTIIYYPFGLLCAAAIAVEIAVLCFTIIGIPLAIIVAKCLGTYLNPVNKVCVSTEVAKELSHRAALAYIDKIQTPAGLPVSAPLAPISESRSKRPELPATPSEAPQAQVAVALPDTETVGGTVLSEKWSAAGLWLKDPLHAAKVVGWGLFAISVLLLFSGGGSSGSFSWPFWTGMVSAAPAIYLIKHGPRNQGIILLCAAPVLAGLFMLRGMGRPQAQDGTMNPMVKHSAPPPTERDLKKPTGTSAGWSSRETSISAAAQGKVDALLGRAAQSMSADSTQTPARIPEAALPRVLVEGTDEQSGLGIVWVVAPNGEKTRLTTTLQMTDYNVCPTGANIAIQERCLGFSSVRIFSRHGGGYKDREAVPNWYQAISDYTSVMAKGGKLDKVYISIVKWETASRLRIRADGEAAQQFSLHDWQGFLDIYPESVKLTGDGDHKATIVSQAPAEHTAAHNGRTAEESWAPQTFKTNAEHSGGTPSSAAAPYTAPAADFDRWLHENWKIDASGQNLVIEMDWMATAGASRVEVPVGDLNLAAAEVKPEEEGVVFRGAALVNIPLREGKSAQIESWAADPTVDGAPWAKRVPANQSLLIRTELKVYAKSQEDARKLVQALRSKQQPVSVEPTVKVEFGDSDNNGHSPGWAIHNDGQRVLLGQFSTPLEASVGPGAESIVVQERIGHDARLLRLFSKLQNGIYEERQLHETWHKAVAEAAGLPAGRGLDRLYIEAKNWESPTRLRIEADGKRQGDYFFNTWQGSLDMPADEAVTLTGVPGASSPVVLMEAAGTPEPASPPTQTAMPMPTAAGLRESINQFVRHHHQFANSPFNFTSFMKDFADTVVNKGKRYSRAQYEAKERTDFLQKKFNKETVVGDIRMKMTAKDEVEVEYAIQIWSIDAKGHHDRPVLIISQTLQRSGDTWRIKRHDAKPAQPAAKPSSARGKAPVAPKIESPAASKTKKSSSGRAGGLQETRKLDNL